MRFISQRPRLGRRGPELLFLTAFILLAWPVPLMPAEPPPDAGGSSASEQGSSSDSPSPIRPQVIYGPDDRIDLYQETDPLRRKLAASTCALIRSNRVRDNGNGGFDLVVSVWTEEGLLACEGEPFADQPVLAECTGFLVGPDLIATAGHCFDELDLNPTRFVFGFQMLDASTPVGTVDADQVYQGVQIVGRMKELDEDYAVVRVDRVVMSPGAEPLDIRRAGLVEVGTPLGVIGHPAGLPIKLAFGEQTAVSDNTPAGFFRANLDTYGGNSGSPVFDAQTGVVEGILVRGETDYVYDGTCFESNRLPNEEAAEEVTKTTVFAQFVPEIKTSLKVLNAPYACGDALEVRLFDASITTGPLQVEVTSLKGDLEILELTAQEGESVHVGSLPFAPPDQPVLHGDQIIQGDPEDMLTVTYLDDDDGKGNMQVLTSQAHLDCVIPTIESVQSFELGMSEWTLEVVADEPVTVQVDAGEVCADFAFSVQSALDTVHRVSLAGLSPCTSYFSRITVTDAAGNTASSTDQTACLEGRTGLPGPGAFFDPFRAGQPQPWRHSALEGEDNWAMRESPFALSGDQVFGFAPGLDHVTDARLVSPPVAAGASLRFWHTYELEAGFDGAVIELSTDDGLTWTDLEPFILEGGYDQSIDTDFNSPIAGRPAWTGGTFGQMRRVLVDLSDFTGPVRVGFRFASDESVVVEGGGGWLIDDFQVGESVSCGAEPQNPPVTVHLPNGGEELEGDSLFEIAWETDIPQAGTGVRFELINDEGHVASLGHDWDPDGLGTTEVYLPLVPAGSDYRVRVISTFDPSLLDDSDEPFTITGGAVRVLAPNGGETWQVGSTQAIHWQTNPMIAGRGVVFELRDVEGPVVALGHDWDPDGESLTLIRVPDVPNGSNYRVRVTSAWAPEMFDTSDEAITIIGTDPGGGDRENAADPLGWTLYE